jgi:hypothetical protein
MMTVNNKLLVEPPQGERKLETKLQSGFASIKQKSNLVGLKVLKDATVQITEQDSLKIPSGSMVYVMEDFLYTQHKVLPKVEFDGDDKKYMILDFSNVIAVDGNENT